VKKDKDTNFACQVCNDDPEKATHVRHWIVTALAYMLLAIKLFAPDYGVLAKRSEQLQSMKSRKAKILESFQPRLELVTFMEDNICSTDMWRDYHAALKLPVDFEKYIEDLEHFFTQREVLTFREELKGYKGFLEKFEK
jgi:hypothetical protein